MWLNFQVINFKAEISVIEKECARAKEAKAANSIVTEIGFGLDGFSKDRLKVRVKCEECKCLGQKRPNAEFCSGRGLLVCGGCECNPGVTQLNI